MFGKNYIEKEVRKKISSMKQLDRIEFITRTNTLVSHSGSSLTSMLVLVSISLVTFLFGINFMAKAISFFLFQINNLGTYYFGLGIISITFSLFFFLLFFYSMFKYSEQEKEAKKKLEEFLEEHSK